MALYWKLGRVIDAVMGAAIELRIGFDPEQDATA
jgi:hypothetical protein